MQLITEGTSIDKILKIIGFHSLRAKFSIVRSTKSLRDSLKRRNLKSLNLNKKMKKLKIDRYDPFGNFVGRK